MELELENNNVKVTDPNSEIQTKSDPETDSNSEATVTKTQELLESLKLEKPAYFNTQQRNILGLIKERLAASIEVETDYGNLDVELDNIEISFVPKKGDKLCLECSVQLDEEGYIDTECDILEVLKVFPARIETDQVRVVERVFETFSQLSEDAYVLREDLPSGIDLHLGDIVKADLIECTLNKYTLRAIRLTLLEKNFGNVKKTLPNTTSTDKHAVSIEYKDRLIFSEQWKRENVKLEITNNKNRKFKLRKVIIQNAENAQIKVVEPQSSTQLDVDGKIVVILEVQAKFIGESKEWFTLFFDNNLKVNRHLTIVVCDTETEAKQAELRLMASDPLRVTGRTEDQRSRIYAHQVWATKSIVIPGEAVVTKRRFVRNQLKSYEVPGNLMEIMLASETATEMEERLVHAYPFVKHSLSFESYVKRFGLLLQLEEIECTVSMRNFDRERAHFQRDGEFLSLHIENLQERRPSIILGDAVRATNPFGGVDESQTKTKTFEGIVHKVLLNRVLLKFNAGFHEQYSGEDYRVTFHFSRFSLRKQHHSIERVVNLMGESFLFPNKIHKRQSPQLDVHFREDNMYLNDRQLPWFNASLNSIQKLAVFHILRGDVDNLPYVIFGPPGTGKTVTLVEAALQLIRHLPRARLLIGTPSNSAADLLTKRIIDSNVLEKHEFIRLVSMNHVEKDMIPEELRSYCATGDIGIVDATQDSMSVTESGLRLRCPSKFIVQHRVIISTCTTLGNLHQMDTPPGHFSHALIDESGQCSEPESVVPISLLCPNGHQVVLAGDPHQLPALILARKAVELGLNMSLLERLLERSPYRKDSLRFPDNAGYNPLVLTKLLHNYRALPSIMGVYSKLFYDDELVPMVCPRDSREALLLADLQAIFGADPVVTVPRTHGTFFHGIMGDNLQEPDSPSWYNPIEARQVFLTAIHLYRRNVRPDQVGILTPYAKQVKTLRSLFTAVDVATPKIGTVEEFQGQERDIMLISTVRSSHAVLESDARLNLGFVRCRKRMNVATSRARCLMIVFGNPHLLSVDECWCQLIVYCCNNNAYFGCELPRRLRENDDKDEDKDNDSQSDKYDFVP
ncbi:hypothetical protein ACLKA7_005822 [Drosophila subpalustris]